MTVDEAEFNIPVRASHTLLAVWSLGDDPIDQATRSVVYELAKREVLEALRRKGGLAGLHITLTTYNSPTTYSIPAGNLDFPEDIQALNINELRPLLRRVDSLAKELEGLAALQARAQNPGGNAAVEERYKEAYEELESLRNDLARQDIALPHDNPHRFAEAVHAYLRVHDKSYAGRERIVREMYLPLRLSTATLLGELESDQIEPEPRYAFAARADTPVPLPTERRVDEVPRSELSVFIAHSSADKVFVRRLAKDLSEKGVSAWVDEAEIRVGDSITEKINAGLEGAHYLAVILSPTSVSSAWVHRELGAALQREIKKRQIVVLPVLLADCRIPAIIADKRYADFRRDYGKGLADLLAAIR